MPDSPDRQSPKGRRRQPKHPKHPKQRKRARRPSPWGRIRRWLGSLCWWKRRHPALDRQRRLQRLLLGRDTAPSTTAQWRALRQRNGRQAKLLIAANKPLRAIQLLTRAQLLDPDHAAYQSLLTKAIELREERRGGKGRSGLMDQVEGPLRQQVLELEAFIASVEEIEQLVERAGYPPLQGQARPNPSPRSRSKSQGPSRRSGGRDTGISGGQAKSGRRAARPEP